MPHRRKPRRNKVAQRLINLEQAAPERDNVIPLDVGRDSDVAPNLVPRMSPGDVDDLVEEIGRRYDAAEPITRQAADEIDRAERQFRGLFPDQEESGLFDDDDSRIFMKKTLEHAQVVHAHLDSLVNQLNPLVRAHPKPSGIYPVRDEVERAKLKEILIDQVFRDNKLKHGVLPRWRWNYLKHPSAYIKTIFNADPVKPDLRFTVVDRSNLFFDPYLTTGNIRDAAWVIERDWVTEDEVDDMVRRGQWHLPGGADEVQNYFGGMGGNSFLNRVLANRGGNAQAIGPERDHQIEVWYYTQAEQRGQPHAYGVVLGGRSGVLVRYGPIPFAFKGIPYRGKSYLQDTYRPDGMSLVNQYRHIQEVYNTFLNLRIEDVLEGVKRQTLIFENLFDEMSEKDFAEGKRFVRANKDFFAQLMDSGRRMEDLQLPLGQGDSTQHLLQDLQYLGAEGEKEVSTGDVFRGQNPQSGATLGQVQEQLSRALGVFRPVFAQEMALIEELGEIVATYLDDPDFFGPERIATMIGPNRYQKAIQGFFTDPATGFSARPIAYDEMDVDVTLDVINAADHIASRTLRTTSFAFFFESLRHHPELMKRAQAKLNFERILTRYLEDMGEDIEAITLTPEEQAEQAQQDSQQRQAAMKAEMQMEQARERLKAEGKSMVEQTKAQARIAEQRERITLEHRTGLTEKMRELMAEHQARMEEANQEFLHDLALMEHEAKLERGAGVDAVGHGGNVNE